jgi:type VI secretion system protein ImpG
MIDELLPYYNAELAYLRELGAEFAARFPKVASRLMLEADKCEDPHVERLLEGFAFLTARLRRKIDDEFPEITDALLGVLYPHYQRPVPSMAVSQLLLGPEAARGTVLVKIPRGAKLKTRPVGGWPCEFRTAYDVDLWPIEVVSAKLEPDRVVLAGKPADAVALIRVALQTSPATTFGKLRPQRLRFYLDGTGPLPFTMYELLLNHVRAVWLRGATDQGVVETVVLPAEALQPVGFGRDEGMFDYPSRSFLGYRLLQEYFAMPEKFLFVDVTGLDAAGSRSFGGSVELLFFLDRAPRGDLGFQKDNLRLGCTPAVNLFTRIAEPIPLSHAKTEYRIVPDVRRPDATEVYSVERVTSAGGLLREAKEFQPFYSVRHSQAGGPPLAAWFATRKPSPRADDSGTEVDLTFVDPGFNPTLPACETVTAQVACTNRDLPERLPFGGEQGDFEIESQAPVGRVRCLRKPTRALRPSLGRDAQWKLISHLSLNHLSLHDSEQGLDALRETLTLYDFADSAVTRQQIAGITSVGSRRAPGRTGRRIGSAVCLGVEVAIEFDESKYVGGGAFLMASVLERFLGLYVSVNSFTQLVAKTRQREGVMRRWPPRAGERSLL